MYQGKNFIFHSNLLVKSSLRQNSSFLLQTSFFPCFRNSNNYVSFYGLLEKESFLFPTMSNNGLNYVSQLFDTTGKIKNCETNNIEFNLENKILLFLDATD